jgi:tetratricopeptide (TPR) repeat protein
MEANPSYGPSYVLQLVVSFGIWYGLGRWGGLSNQSQQYEVILIWMFAFRPLSTLIHELGHAAAVMRLARRPADVIVGAGSPALKGRIGQLQIRFSPVPILGSQVGGLCRYSSEGVSWRTRGWISLAGPGATLIELLVMLALMPLWSHASVVARDLLAVGTAMLALNVFTNLLPTPLVRDPHGRVVLGRDGYNALEAFRNARGTVPLRGAAATPAASVSLPDAEAAARRAAFRVGGKLPDREPAPVAARGDALADALVDAFAEAPGDAVTQAPGDAPATPRTLAEIWSIQQPVVEQPPAEPAARVRALAEAAAAGGQPARGDGAQRALAEIWSTQPDTRGAAAETASATRRAAAAPVVEEVPESTDGKLELAAAHLEAGHPADAIPLLEAAIGALRADVDAGADAGSGEADTLAAARDALARAYLAARRPQLAIGLYELLLADTSPALDRGRRLAYRIALAQAFRAVGKAAVAIDQLEALVAELTSVDDHERLIDAQIELATTYVVAHRIKDAVDTYETALPLAERLLGAGHRRSLSVRLLLARAYQQDGRPQLATRSFRSLANDAERALGPSDTLTRQAQSELAALIRNERR